jgi:hypothetical protein
MGWAKTGLPRAVVISNPIVRNFIIIFLAKIAKHL